MCCACGPESTLTNDALWINHSCDPNYIAVIEDGKTWIDRIRDIVPGEELADDAFTLPERHTRQPGGTQDVARATTRPSITSMVRSQRAASNGLCVTNNTVVP